MGKMAQPEILREKAFFCQMWLNVAEVLGLYERAALGESMARTGFSCQQRHYMVGLLRQKTSHE